MNGLLLALMMAGGITPPPVAPPPPVYLSDLERFPPTALTEAYSHFAWEHMDWLRERKKFWLTTEERDYWRARFDDQHWRWDVWSDLAAIHSDVSIGDTAAALGTLTRLRKKLGDDAYWRGDMPSCCAVWLFQRSD